MEVTIYINPDCSKCQGACDLLDINQVKATRIEYLTHPPGLEELRDLQKKLGIPAEDMVRQTEPVFIEKYSGKQFTEEEWLQLLVHHPVLLQRPIVIRGDKAVIARPPEKLLELLGD